MKFVIYSYNQPEISQIIAERLRIEGYQGESFSDSLKMFETIKIMHIKPDVIILDYQTFNHDIYDINFPIFYERLEIPVIYYNDPCPTSYSLANHWIYQTIRFYKQRRQETPYEYLEIFSDLEDIVLDENLMPYINLLCQPKTLVQDNPAHKDPYDTFIENFDMPKNLSFLFYFFITNKEKKITIKDIQNYYTQNSKSISESSLKVMISNLRKFFENNQESDLYLCKKGDFYILIQI